MLTKADRKIRLTLTQSEYEVMDSIFEIFINNHPVSMTPEQKKLIKDFQEVK